MSGQEAMGAAGKIIERWGFPVMAAVALMWFVRADIVVPMVEAHTKFLDEMTVTQRELVQAMQEQTRLLYALQPKTAAYKPHDDSPQN
jgi:hypothetical protein